MSRDEPVTGVSTERTTCGNCGCTIDREVAQSVDGVFLCPPCSDGDPCPRCNPSPSRKCWKGELDEAYRKVIDEMDDEVIEEMDDHLDLDKFRRSIGGIHLDRVWRELKGIGYDKDPIRIVIEPEMAFPDNDHYSIRFEPLELVSIETGEPVDRPSPVSLDEYEYRPVNGSDN